MDNRQAYAESGVNVEEGYKAVQLMKEHVRSTFSDRVIGDLGSFGGLFRLGTYNDPVLVSGTDGVGTKLKIAFLTDKHDTVGIDLVAMCVNDILCQGAEPLFFLDYIATGRLEAEKAAHLVSGVANGCRQSGMALLGGETAEMPGFYGDGEYDMAGFAVGVVEKERIIDGSKISEGDVLIGLASSGVHSNGYSLVRRIFLDQQKMGMDDVIGKSGKTLGEFLIEPTRIYVNAVRALMEKVDVHGMSHITGGGFHENIPRMLPEGLQVNVNESSWTKPEIFELIQSYGKLETLEMFHTFNMGIGFVAAVAKEDAESALEALKAAGEEAAIIGHVEAGDKGVVLCL
jgi:phosphoribosylformylglycinamidine cyclo-ligase